MAGAEGTRHIGRRSPGTLGVSVNAGGPTDQADRSRRLLEERLRDPRPPVKDERLYREMFEQFAPATEGSVVRPGRKRRGRLIFGDATEKV